MKKIFLLLFTLPLILVGKELFSNNDWKIAKKDGSPEGPWQFGSNGSYKFFPAKDNNLGVVKITPNGKSKSACLTYNGPVKFPAGSTLTVTGEYRTIDFNLGKNGQVLVNIGINFNLPNKAWMGVFLKPTASVWTKFVRTKKFSESATGPFRAYFYAKGDSGSVEFRNLKLDVTSGSSKINNNNLYAFREGEEVFKKLLHVKYNKCSNGKAAYGENKPFNWKFRIAPVTDKKTLFEKEFTYHIWIRNYGYLGNPIITTKLNDKVLSKVKTVANEKTDAKGKYAGPGTFYWQYIGNFKSKGGTYSLSFSAERLFIDSCLITDDENYLPQEFEAKRGKSNRLSDVTFSNELYAEFSSVGVSSDVSYPVSFRITKPVKIIPKGQKPAIFHFSLPEYIEVLGATSHRATEKWGQDNTWLGRPLKWRKTSQSIVDGIKYNNYQMDIYYLCGNQYWWILKVKKEAFKENKRVKAIYYLENGKEKQIPETMYLTMTKVPKAKPFKRIYICGGGGEFSGFWNGWQDVFNSSKHAGINSFGLWGFERGTMAAQKEFTQNAKAHNIRIFGALSPFWPPVKLPPNERAIGKDNKYYKRGNMYVPALYQDENSSAMKYMISYLKKSAKAGSQGILLDDEWSNQIYDKVDYHQETKKMFKKYCESKKVQYVDPLIVVNNKRKYPKLYQLWVDFRCERMAFFYSVLRKAYVNNLLDKSNPIFSCCIQGRRSTPSKIKETNFFDYRLLAKHCDIITIMCYTYSYISQSSEVGDTLDMFNKYVGKNICAPALLSEYEGCQIPEDQKAMQKYQLWEALFAQAKLIEYWMSYGMYNPRNLRHIADGMRQLSNYEDILLDGKRVDNCVSTSKLLRVKAILKGKQILVYVANYQHPTSIKSVVKLTLPIKNVTALVNDKAVNVKDNSFIFDSKIERGQLFLVEIK